MEKSTLPPTLKKWWFSGEPRKDDDQSVDKTVGLIIRNERLKNGGPTWTSRGLEWDPISVPGVQWQIEGLSSGFLTNKEE